MNIKNNKLYFYLPILLILLTNFIFSLHVLLIENLLGFQYFFEVSVVLTVFLIFILGALAILSLRYARANKEISNSQTNYNLSVIVPVYNEESLITKTLNAIANQVIPGSMFEIIVVNDGSEDQSLNLIQDFAQSSKVNVSVINSINNEGKKNALVRGFHASKGDIIITVDSDTILESHAISNLCEHFDERTSAVCGYSSVLNNHQNLLTKIQDYEYFISHELFKSFESSFNLVQCCPGCFTAYRKQDIFSVIDEFKNSRIFDFPVDYAEDRFLTALLISKEKKIKYSRSAKSQTEVPSSLKSFVIQRKRWIKSWFINTIFLFSRFSKFPFIFKIYFFTSFLFNILIVSYIPILLFHILNGNSSLILYSILIIFLYVIFELCLSKKLRLVIPIMFFLLNIFIYSWLTLSAISSLRDNSWGVRSNAIS